MLKRLFPPYLFAADQGTPTGTANTPPPATTAEPPKPEEGAKPKEGEKTGEGSGDMSGIRAFVTTFLDDKKPTTPQPAKPEGEKPKETAPAAAAAPAKPKPKTKPAPQVTNLTPEQIAAAAAEGTARAMAAQQQAKPAATKPAPAATTTPEFDDNALPESAREKLPILKRIEELYADNPKYKDLANRFRQSTKALQDYAAQWEAANPGRTFDENETDEDGNSVHEAFFAKHDVPWEDDHYVQALADIRAEERAQKLLKPTQEKLNALERSEKLREEQPKIAQEMLGAARKLWEELGVPDLLDEKGGVNQAKLAELQKGDSWSFNLRNGIWNQIDAETSALYSILNRLVDFDPNNPVHKTLNEFVAQRENELIASPLTEQLDEKGRPFVPMDKFYTMSQAEQTKHWTFSVKDLAALRASELAGKAKAAIDQREADFRAWAEARGIKVEGNPAPTGQPATTKPTPEPTGAGTKPNTPTIDAETGLAASQRKVGDGTLDARSSFFSKFLQ